jgi:Tfp pilus assembly protein PilX
MLRRSHRDQRGQSLVIVLSLITILFLLGSSLAVHASVALRATRTSAGEGNDFYAADAATELGIWWQRNGKAGNPPAQTINGITTSTTITSVGGGGGSCPADPKPIWLSGAESGVVSFNMAQVSLLAGTLIDWGFGGGDQGVVTSPVRSGSYALRVHPTTSAGSYYSVDKNLQSIANTIVLRFSIQLAALPSADASMFMANFNGGKLIAGYYKASTGKWALTFASSSANFGVAFVEGPTVTAGTWYDFDLRLVNANPRTAEWQVNGTPYSTISSSEAAGTSIIQWQFGNTNIAPSTDVTMYFDDMMASDRSSDYPLGDVKIAPLLPNGMGTHNDATRFQDNDSTAIDAASYQRIDDIPQTSTADYVKQISYSTGAEYATFTFQDTTETCIRGASLVAALHSASTASNNIALNSVTSGFNFNIFAADPSETTLRYAQGMVSANGVPGGGPWTQAAINSIEARFGMSTDVNPVPFLDAVLLEYGYRPIIASPATITIVGTGGGSTVSTSYTDAGAGVPSLTTWTTTK